MAEIPFEDIMIPLGEEDDPFFALPASGTFEVDPEGCVETITLEGVDAYGEAVSKTFFPSRTRARQGSFDDKIFLILASQIEIRMKDAIEEAVIDMRESIEAGREYEAAE